MLVNLGLELEEVRKDVLNVLGHGVGTAEGDERRAAGGLSGQSKGGESASRGAMFERFTDRARKVMHLANQEAHRFNHEYVGTEHLLLGLIKEQFGVAANVLRNFDVDLRTIRREVETLVRHGPDIVTMGTLPQTRRAKKVIEYAIEEAWGWPHEYVGTEHLLLSLLREKDGIAAQVLRNLGLQLE